MTAYPWEARPDDAERLRDEGFTDDEIAELQDPVEALVAELLDTGDLDNIPAPEPIITGTLFVDSIARIYGESGSFKSFMTLDFAGCVGTGLPWHGRQVAQGLVIYLVAEGARGIRKRVRAWEQHHGRKMTGVKFLPRPVQSDSPEWNTLIAACERLRPSLIIIDTQARVTVGVEENSATEMGRFIHRVEQLRAASGACVLLVHHSGYRGDHGRGSTSVKGAMQTELSVTRKGKGVRETRVTLSTGKQKDDDELPDMVFALQVVELAGEAGWGGLPVTSVVLVPTDQEAEGQVPGSVEDGIAKLDAMDAPTGWSRRTARTEAAKRGIVLPRDTVLSEAIKYRRDREESGSQSGSQPSPQTKIGEPLPMVPESGTTPNGTAGQSGSAPPGTSGNQGATAPWFPPTPPLGVGTAGATPVPEGTVSHKDGGQAGTCTAEPIPELSDDPPGVYRNGSWAAAGHPGLTITADVCRFCGYPGGSPEHRHACADRIAAVEKAAQAGPGGFAVCSTCGWPFDSAGHASRCEPAA